MAEGRITTAEYADFYYVTVYTPNSKSDLSRLSLRHTVWGPWFLAYLQHLEKSKPVVFSGDLNVAYSPDDLAQPQSQCWQTWLYRRGQAKLLDAGFVSTHFAYLRPQAMATTAGGRTGPTLGSQCWLADRLFSS